MAQRMSPEQAAASALASFTARLTYHEGRPMTKRAALALSNSASAALVHAGTSHGLRSLLLAVAKGCLAAEAAPAGHPAYAARAAESVAVATEYLLRGTLPEWLKPSDF